MMERKSGLKRRRKKNRDVTIILLTAIIIIIGKNYTRIKLGNAFKILLEIVINQSLAIYLHIKVKNKKNYFNFYYFFLLKINHHNNHKIIKYKSLANQLSHPA